MADASPTRPRVRHWRSAFVNVGTSTGRCESCQQPGRVLVVLRDVDAGLTLELCEGCDLD